MAFKKHLLGNGAQPPLTNCSWEETRMYYIDSRKSKAEHLVLYCDIKSFIPWKSKTNKPKYPKTLIGNWIPLSHQTAGNLCHHQEIFARFLTPSKPAAKLIAELNTTYLDSNIWDPASLTDINAYEAILRKYKVSANTSYPKLQEAFYPIDLEYISKLTTDEIPKNLCDHFEPSKDKIKRMWGYHFHVAILGKNCD